MFGRAPVELCSFAWPTSRLGEAIEYLARKGKLLPLSVEAPTLPQDLVQADDETLGRWLEAVTGQLGLEAEPVESAYADVDRLVRGAGPAILRLPGALFENEPRFLVLLKGGQWISVVGPDLSLYHVRPEVIRDALCYELEAPYTEQTDQFLASVGVPEHRRARARKAILSEQLGPARIGGCWLLRLSPGANLWNQTRRARLLRPWLTFMGGHAVQLILSILAWWVIGWGALSGRFDQGWLWAWSLILFTTIPFQVLITVAQSQFAIRAGGLFKQRLLYGTLRLEPEEIRHQGAGQFLGRVMESEAVELRK